MRSFLSAANYFLAFTFIFAEQWMTILRRTMDEFKTTEQSKRKELKQRTMHKVEVADDG